MVHQPRTTVATDIRGPARMNRRPGWTPAARNRDGSKEEKAAPASHEGSRNNQGRGRWAHGKGRGERGSAHGSREGRSAQASHKGSHGHRGGGHSAAGEGRGERGSAHGSREGRFAQASHKGSHGHRGGGHWAHGRSRNGHASTHHRASMNRQNGRGGQSWGDHARSSQGGPSRAEGRRHHHHGRHHQGVPAEDRSPETEAPRLTSHMVIPG